MIISLFILLLAFMTSKINIRFILDLLKKAGCTRMNYRGKEVIFAAGITFIPILMLMTTLYLCIFRSLYPIFISYILGFCAIGFAGILDDLLGEKNIKGWKSHFACLLKGHVTTGFIKAFIGGLTAVLLSISISRGSLDFILNSFNIALFTNTLNLMDLRPGRSVKAFILAGLFIFVANFRNYTLFLPLVIALVMAIAYLPFDLKELCMQGDTGSNILGLTLGYFSSLSSLLIVKLLLFLSLIVINITAEKVSLTVIISKNKLLNYFDSIGRSS